VVYQRRVLFPLAVALLVAFSSSRVPAQSSGGSGTTLAIVGARVVDGSGNEPFDGTVVVRDGRIAEVGRTVRPPEGARIIEAQGRTVMPGLFDIRVHLPAAASASGAASDEALAKALAAYLYAGVTSVGVADLDERKLDALRDHLSAAKIRSPRLVAASAPANAVFGSSLSGSGGAPEASSSALAMAQWKQRNATLAPEVTAAGSSGRAAALEVVRAAKQAGVRLAVASNAGQAELAPGEATLLELRALVEAGLTPLQALTAATSGSAWALGLQSDRGFLAVGQRADLLILTSEPGSASGEVAQVAQVFLGGEEIDRAALHTLMTKPDAAPAPTSSTETTAGTAPGGGAAASAGKASVETPNASTAAAGGKTAARGKRGRTKGSAATAANADTNATAPATAADAAGATAKPYAGTKPDATGKASTAASASPSAATTTTSPGSPTSPTSASPTSSTEPTPDGGGASPAGAGGTAAAAAAAGGAAAPIPMTEPMIDDFEDSGDNSSTGLGGTWTASNETGTHTTDVILGRVVRGLRDHALHLTARMGDTKEAYARISVALAKDGHPADVSHFHGLRFDARGQGRYRVLFITRSVADGRYHESYFSGSPLWTPVSIPFATLGQTGPGKHVTWTGKDLIEIAFQLTRDPGQMGWLELDNVRLY
jgi:imidazolonepropionase-like amidohydrolase